MPNFQKIITLFMTITIVGCGASVPTITPYKMDIQQGNVVTSEMLLKLRPGMTKSQVQFIMGTPLLVDSFHSDRWDYFYRLRKQGKVINQRRVILDFEGESLARVRGDVVPEGADIDALMADGKSSASETKPVEAAAIEPVIEVIEEPVIATEAVEAVAEQEKATVTPEPMKDELLDPVPEAVVEAVAPLPSSITSERRAVLRLERQLDAGRAEQAVPVVETLPAVEAEARSNASEVPPKLEPSTDSLPNQEEPGFFERALEKIGF